MKQEPVPVVLESEKVQKIKSMIKSGDIKTNSKEELERLIDSITKFL